MRKEILIKQCSIILLIVSAIMITLCLNNFLFFLPSDFNDEINVCFLLLAPMIALLNTIILFMNIGLKNKTNLKSSKKYSIVTIISGIISYIPLVIGILAILQWGSVA